MAMLHKKSQKQALIWLVMAGIMLILWFFMSLFDGTPVTAKERKKTQVVAEDFALPLTIDHLNELAREVPPIDFTTVVQDLRNYPAEFKVKSLPNISKGVMTVKNLPIFVIIIPTTNSVIFSPMASWAAPKRHWGR